MVLSHDLWRERFESDPGVVGRTVRLREPTGTATFARVFLVDPTDDAAAEGWARRAIETPPDSREPELRHPSAAAFRDDGGYLHRVLAVLLGLAVAVWVTTLLTGANLIVSDTLARRSEYRLRSALGARTIETVARLGTDAALLATGAAALAVGIASALAKLAPWLLPLLGGVTRIQVTIDGGTLGVVALVGAASAVVAALPGIAVALHVARSSEVGRVPGSSRFAAVGLGIQVALASSLVVVTGISLATLHSWTASSWASGTVRPRCTSCPRRIRRPRRRPAGS